MEYKSEYKQQNNIKDIKLFKKSVESNNKNSDVDLKNYIGQLNENTLLKDILVIQSHNSGAIDQVYSEKGVILKNVFRISGNIPGRFANCQILSLKDQFNTGVRAFDIRIKKFKEDWYFEHGPTISKEPIYSEINNLVEVARQNPKELIFIFIRSTNQESMINSDWYKSLKEHCFKPDGKNLCDHSIKEVCNSKNNIILISSSSYNPDPASIWNEYQFEECWNATACGSDNRDLKMNYFRDTIKSHSNKDHMFGIKIPNTTERSKFKKFLKFFQNETSVFPLKDTKEVTYKDSKEIINWLEENNQKLNFIAVDGVGLENVNSSIRHIRAFNLKRNHQIFK